MITLTEGLEVYYKNLYGVIKYVGARYCTLCIKPNEEKVRQTCLVIYQNDYDKIELYKQSQK